MKFIERKLDAMTMYRVVIYALCVISFTALALSIMGVLWASPVALILSLIVGVAASLIAHMVCVRVWRAPGNLESSLITALILFLILTPVSGAGLWVTAFVNAGAIVLKYVVQYKARHLFNPVALVLFLAGLVGYYGAEWWVGSRYLLPVVFVVGFLVVMKTRRWPLFTTYIGISTVTAAVTFLGTTPITETIIRHFISWPTIFFAAFMLTEPLGLPSTKKLQYAYAGIAGVLSAVPFSFGILHGTPEFALLVANLFTFVIDRPVRLKLLLTHVREVGKQTVEYFFTTTVPAHFVPGQYLEWTLPHSHPDARGIRRYFTIASAPSAKEISFAVRHVEKQSTWKAALAKLRVGEVLYATQKAGDFTLRKSAPHHVWIAGGIGITPFMSMARDAVLRGEQISVTLFYCNKTKDDIAFRDEIAQIFTTGMSVIHVLEMDPEDSFPHETGFITEEMLKRRVPEWSTATYYVSGPPGLVNAYKKLLRSLSIPHRRIVTDYFPGLA